MQIQEQLVKFGKILGVKSLVIYGGVSKHDQIRDIQKGVHIVVATPGRLLDLVNDAYLDLSNVDYFVLDEADRLLDMGFEVEIIKITKMLKEKRQTVMFRYISLF